MLNQSDVRPRSVNDLDLWYSYRFMYSFKYLHLPTLTSLSTIVSEISIVLTFSHIKAWDQIWSCRKISQGQSRVIIWTNLVVLEHPMLHSKFQGHRPFGSEEEDFLRFSIFNGGHLGHVTWTVWTNFRFPISRRIHMKFGCNWPSGFRGEDFWKSWRRTTEAYLSYKLTNEPLAQVN